MKPIQLKKGEFIISTNIDTLDIPFIHDFLSNEADWSKNISFETVEKSINSSLNFGLYHNDKQIGFSRIISDFSTIAYLGDVFVIKEYRGKGLSKWLMEVIVSHPGLQGLRRWILLTDSAKWLYEKYGFSSIKSPEIYMEKHNPYIYEKEV